MSKTPRPRTATSPAAALVGATLAGVTLVALTACSPTSTATGAATGATASATAEAASGSSGSCAATALVDGDIYYLVGDGTTLGDDTLTFTVGEQIGTATLPAGCADTGEGTSVAVEGASGLVHEVDGVDPSEVVAITDAAGGAPELYSHAADDGGSAMSDVAEAFVTAARGA